MTMHRVWRVLIYLGDGALLIPCAGLLFAWLLASSASRRLAWYWLVAVLVAGGGVALSKLLYMVSGLRPEGWNFIGLSGHAALSFLFWPTLGALVARGNGHALRTSMIALGGCLALAITTASWVLRDHSLAEVVLGAAWGALVAGAFLAIAWRHVMPAASTRTMMIASLALLASLAFGREFPSTRVLSWIAAQATGTRGVHTRTDLGPRAQLSNKTKHHRSEAPAEKPTRTAPPEGRN